jgi:hypothetical protein
MVLHKNRQADQWNRREEPEISSHISDQGVKMYVNENIVSSTNGVEYPHVED